MLLTDVICIWFNDKMLFTLITNQLEKKWRMACGATKNKTLEQKRFFVQEWRPVSCYNGDRRRIEIGLRQCDIRQSCSSNQQNVNKFSWHSRCVPYATSFSSLLSKRMAQHTQNTLVYRPSQGSVATCLRCGVIFMTVFYQVFAECTSEIIVKIRRELTKLSIWS